MIDYKELKRKLIEEIEEGKHKCKYCGRKARFLTSGKVLCCQPKAKLCSNYGVWVSKIRRQVYRNNPKLKEKMSIAMKEVHNRPEVITKKQEAMLNLHHGDCIECQIFQKNYDQGRNNFRKDSREKTLQTLRYYGYDLNKATNKTYAQLYTLIKKLKDQKGLK